MNTNEEKLRKRYKDRFIGCFHRKNNDEVCFDDIRGEYGDCQRRLIVKIL